MFRFFFFSFFLTPFSRESNRPFSTISPPSFPLLFHYVLHDIIILLVLPLFLPSPRLFLLFRLYLRCPHPYFHLIYPLHHSLSFLPHFIPSFSIPSPSSHTSSSPLFYLSPPPLPPIPPPLFSPSPTSRPPSILTTPSSPFPPPLPPPPLPHLPLLPTPTPLQTLLPHKSRTIGHGFLCSRS